MDLKSILDTTNDNTFFDEVIRDYYDNRILILNNEIDANLVNEEITKLENETENKINGLNEAQDNIIMQVNSV